METARKPAREPAREPVRELARELARARRRAGILVTEAGVPRQDMRSDTGRILWIFECCNGRCRQETGSAVGSV